jgi:DNA replication and repair protein RecF
MYLKYLTLTQFKNHSLTKWSPEGRIQVVTGRNGTGKTNLLDAIHLLCLGKSYFSSGDAQHATWGTDFYRVEATFESSKGQERVVVKSDGKNKKIELDDIPYKTVAEHVGRFPCTVVAPQDIALVVGFSEVRRKFLDMSISQTAPAYLKDLMQYNQILKQRNALLKNGASIHVDIVLDSLDQRLIPLAERIFKSRADFFENFMPVFEEIHQILCGGSDPLSIKYLSGLSTGDFTVKLQQSRHKDKLLQRTAMGIHRDDFSLEIKGSPLHKSGSQGQIKTAVFALKMAQYHFLSQQLQERPILLLDDVFDKLDPFRIDYLMSIINDNHQYGQIFVTDTYPDRLLNMATDREMADITFYDIAKLLAQ